MKWTYKQKVKFVNDYLEKGVTPRFNGIHYKRLRGCIIYWSKRVLKNGYQSLKHNFTHWTTEQKLIAVQRVINGETIRSVAADLNIKSISTLLVWVRKYDKFGIDGLKLKKRGRPPSNMSKLKDKEFKNEKEELEYLRAENAYLKKLKALIQQRKEQQKKK